MHTVKDSDEIIADVKVPGFSSMSVGESQISKSSRQLRTHGREGKRGDEVEGETVSYHQFIY